LFLLSVEKFQSLHDRWSVQRLNVEPTVRIYYGFEMCLLLGLFLPHQVALAESDVSKIISLQTRKRANYYTDEKPNNKVQGVSVLA